MSDWSEATDPKSGRTYYYNKVVRHLWSESSVLNFSIHSCRPSRHLGQNLTHNLQSQPPLLLLQQRLQLSPLPQTRTMLAPTGLRVLIQTQVARISITKWCVESLCACEMISPMGICRPRRHNGVVRLAWMLPLLLQPLLRKHLLLPRLLHPSPHLPLHHLQPPPLRHLVIGSRPRIQSLAVAIGTIASPKPPHGRIQTIRMLE